MTNNSETTSPTAVGKESQFSALVNLLVRRRHTLLVLYFAVVSGFVSVLAIYGADAGITISHGLFRFLRGDDNPWSIIDDDLELDWVDVTIFVFIFLGLQAGFLWGGGRIVVGRTRAKWYKIVVSAVIIATMATLLVLGAILLFTQFLMTKSVDQSDALAVILMVTLPIVWVIWLIIAWVQFRNHDRPSALGKLSGALIAGSWVEFALALPIDIATRPRHESCLCFSGSWLSLMIIIPVMIWSFGPALYVLYLRERTLARGDPGRPRRILRAKSIFQRRRRVDAP